MLSGDGDILADDSDDQVYAIEKILRAERVGGHYRIWIKWKGFDEISFRLRHELVKEIGDAETLAEIEAAVALAKATSIAPHGELPPEESDATPQPAPEQLDDLIDEPPDDRPIAQRLKRRTRAARINLILERTRDFEAEQVIASAFLSKLAGLKAACDDSLSCYLSCPTLAYLDPFEAELY